MGITRQNTLIHWNYFLAIEEDLLKLSRYVDFSSQNDDTFSLEIARILMASSAEIDVVLKQLSIALDASSAANNINQYHDLITPIIPNFKSFKVSVPTQGLELTPWISWQNNTPPLWWSANNKVKHHRHEHFDKASLKNCLNSVAALYISVLHLYAPQANSGELLQLPRLFNVDDEFFGGTSIGRYGHSFRYRISL
jgi:hypothetical protein